MYACCAYIEVCVSRACGSQGSQRRMPDLLDSRVRDGCKPPCWVLALEAQSSGRAAMFFTSVLSLQPPVLSSLGSPASTSKMLGLTGMNPICNPYVFSLPISNTCSNFKWEIFNFIPSRLSSLTHSLIHSSLPLSLSAKAGWSPVSSACVASTLVQTFLQQPYSLFVFLPEYFVVILPFFKICSQLKFSLL